MSTQLQWSQVSPESPSLYGSRWNLEGKSRATAIFMIRSLYRHSQQPAGVVSTCQPVYCKAPAPPVMVRYLCDWQRQEQLLLVPTSSKAGHGETERQYGCPLEFQPVFYSPLCTPSFQSVYSPMIDCPTDAEAAVLHTFLHQIPQLLQF